MAEDFPIDSAGFAQFQADMAKYDPRSTYRAGDLFDAWLAANVVAQAAKTLPTVSAKSLLNYFSTTTSINTFGATDPLNFTVPDPAMGGLIPRLCDAKDALYHYVNGQLVEVTPFVDLLPGA